MKIHNRLSIDPQVCHGKPYVAGHRIPVAMVLEFVAAGISFDDMIRQYYPTLIKKDIAACVLYAKHLSNLTTD